MKHLPAILKTEIKSEIPENGKPSERAGRKATGLNPRLGTWQPGCQSFNLSLFYEKEKEIMAKNIKKLFALILAISMVMKWAVQIPACWKPWVPQS